MQIKRSVRIDESLDDELNKIAEVNNTTYTAALNDAIAYYRDYCFMKEKASFLNEEIVNIFKANIDLLAKRLNNRTNKLLSEMAIQLGIINMVLGHNLEIEPEQLELYRTLVVEQLRQDNRVFKLEDVIDDA